PEDFLWPDAMKGPWCISVKWALVDGRPEAVGIEAWFGVKPDRDDPHRMAVTAIPGQSARAITAESLRLPFGVIIRQDRRGLEAQARRIRSHVKEEERRAAEDETLEGESPWPEGFADWLESYAEPFERTAPKRTKTAARSAPRQRRTLDPETLDRVATA